MTLKEFHNALRILMNMDRHELDKAGLQLSAEDWWEFQNNPWKWFIRASSREAQKVWSVIQKRQVGGVR